MLLSEISQFTTSIDAKFVFDNWRLHTSDITMETTMPLVQIVVAIGNLAQSLSKIAVQDMKGELCTHTHTHSLSLSHTRTNTHIRKPEEMVQLLQRFVLNPAVIQAVINTLCQICSALNKTPKDYQVKRMQLYSQLYWQCNKLFSSSFTYTRVVLCCVCLYRELWMHGVCRC